MSENNEYPQATGSNNPTTKATGFTHDSVANKSVDWYTPPWVFEALGLEFDLDPCQPEAKIPWIPAKRHYCLADDGLEKKWDGLVWLNPPYGKHTPDWLKKMHKHRNGIALVFARTDCAWFHNYCTKADAILFLSGRIKFVDGLCVTGGGGAGSGSMLIAWGDTAVDALERIRARGLFLRLAAVPAMELRVAELEAQLDAVGAGRKPDPEPKKPRAVRLSDRQAKAFQSLGGVAWLQGQCNLEIRRQEAATISPG